VGNAALSEDVNNIFTLMPDREIAGNSFFFSTPAAASSAEPSARSQMIAAIRAGDNEAFGQFYREFAPLVHGILLARLPRDEVQDAVQEVFLAAYRHIGSLRDENAIGGWVARIARNHVVDHYRSSKKTDELPEEIDGGRDRRAEAEEVLDAIRSLPTAYRETLVLRLVEGMTGNEIAEKTGLSPDSVRVNLHRGMNLLRKSLGIAGAK
jgi:RNA polymerase sigma-70 factor (ECF subfamily)